MSYSDFFFPACLRICGVTYFYLSIEIINRVPWMSFWQTAHCNTIQLGLCICAQSRQFEFFGFNQRYRFKTVDLFCYKWEFVAAASWRMTFPNTWCPITRVLFLILCLDKRPNAEFDLHLSIGLSITAPKFDILKVMNQNGLLQYTRSLLSPITLNCTSWATIEKLESNHEFESNFKVSFQI